MKLVITHLYPDSLNLYGDRGNIECLQKRCLWRDIKCKINKIDVDDELDQKIMNETDILFIGGGEDHSQKKIYDDFINIKGSLIRDYINVNKVALFICGSYQLLGQYYLPYAGKKITGLEILDLYTKHFGRDKKRCVGNVVCKINNLKYLRTKQLVGFENHGGRTYFDDKEKALALLTIGSGNNNKDKTEGYVHRNSISTYLHGPLLPKNPHLADYLIKTALEKQLEEEVELEPLDDELEWDAHKNAVKLN